MKALLCMVSALAACDATTSVEPFTAASAADVDTHGCPPAMVFIEKHGMCIDAYEATVRANADCTGVRYGINETNDYPAGFSRAPPSHGCENGSCRGCPTTEPTVNLYACSQPGVVPSSSVTWFQARRLCENSGKVLCPENVWFDACGGPENNDYPYGTAFIADVCNLPGYSDPAHAVASGSASACEGGYPGIFDMLGNLNELVDSADRGDVIAGGAYSGGAGAVCATSAWLGGSCTDIPPFTGFRCCVTPK